MQIGQSQEKKLFSTWKTCPAVSITTINCYSVKLTNAVQIIFTFAKVAVIMAIVGAGLVLLVQDGGTDNLKDGFRGSTTSVSAIAVAFYSGLFSYDGW